jgi:Zn2+/Cd2+-exporting ATPase
VSKRAQDTTLAKIVQLVEEARSEKSPTQRFIETFEEKYAWAIVGIVALMATIPPLLGQPFEASFYRAMTLLVVASPCALVISTPASILSAIANGAREGILFKGGAHLENLAAVKVIALDKTGTLTHGRPRVTDVVALDGRGPNEVLSLAAAVESLSEHPIAAAVVAEAQARSVTIPLARDGQAVAGYGIYGTVDGERVWVGKVSGVAVSPTLDTQRSPWAEATGLRDQSPVGLVSSPVGASPNQRGGFSPAQLVTLIEELQGDGKTAMVVTNQSPLGVIAVADTLRPEAAQSVAQLKRLGIQRVAMLTGDNRRAAEAIAREAGIDEVHADLLPADKVRLVKQLDKQYGAVALVGDGVNDAPALAAASVGVAMGAAGSDVALETADVVLMASDLQKLPYAVALGRQATRVVKQNLAIALTVIVVLILSTFLGVLPLPLGVVGHEGSTVVVVLNGLRLLRYKPKL